MPVKQTPSSSAIERVGYNPETRNLSIWFRGGRRYVYADVPRELYDELCESGSAGAFVNAAIKGRFPSHAEPRRKYHPNPAHRARTHNA